jgi:4-carboxymuconolactone decarboxylase
MVVDGEWRSMSQTARFRETLLRLTIIDEGFVKDEAGLALGSAATSALDLKTAALLQVGASVTVGPSPVCLQWSVTRAMAAGATEDEIADVLLAIAPVTGLGRIAAAAPDVAIALGYDVAAALEELDEIALRESTRTKDDRLACSARSAAIRPRQQHRH